MALGNYINSLIEQRGSGRKLVGAIAFVLSAGTAIEALTLINKTPNQLADSIITNDYRKEMAAMEQAITKKTGPVYKAVLDSCAEEEAKYSAARLSMPFTSQVLVGNKPFNKESCLASELSSKTTFYRPLPEKGKATDDYKERVLASEATFVAIFGAVGGLMVAWGARASARGRKETDAANDSDTPSTPNTPALG